MATTKYAYLPPDEKEPYERLTERQRDYIDALLDEKPLDEFKPVTPTTLINRGFLESATVLTIKCWDRFSPMFEHPASTRAIQALIDAGPQEVHQTKWPHWPLIGKAQRGGRISLKVDPAGGFGSEVVRVTIAWREPT